jgi:hypothetical protein
MSSKVADQLREAMRERQLVRFERKFEEHNIHGYVLDVGPKFFLLALVSDRLWFDGFEIFRIADIRNLRPDPFSDFAERALKLRNEMMPEKPSVDLSGIDQILASAASCFPLVTIHRETVDPEVCWIGKVFSVVKGRVDLLAIGPDAKWEDEPTVYRTSEITRVSFGGDYEEALRLVSENDLGI